MDLLKFPTTFQLLIKLLLLLLYNLPNYGSTKRIDVGASGGGGRLDTYLEGPSLTHHPEPITYFSNALGTVLTCHGKGIPPLSVSWYSTTGEILQDVPGLRETLSNGSLYFGPFSPEEFMSDVHNSQVQCGLRNPVGTLLSPIFTVKGVLDSPFELLISGPSSSSLDGSEIIEGNPIVLQCIISPSSAGEWVQIQTWKTVDQFGYQAPIRSDGIMYQITASGSLIIYPKSRNVNPQKALAQQLFVCIGNNKLNPGLSQVSSSPFLLKYSTTTSQGIHSGPPRTSGRWEQTLVIDPGKSVDLICSASGNPPLQFRWEKWVGSQKLPIITTTTSPTTTGLHGSFHIYGPILTFISVEPNSNGSYRCEVFNSEGSIYLDYHLIVNKPLSLTIESNIKRTGSSKLGPSGFVTTTTRLGSNVEFNCKSGITSPTTANSISNNNNHIIWYKNGQILNGGMILSRIKLNGNKLSILNTELDDQGIYQCFVHYEGHSAQASTQLIFEAILPELQQTFISQTLQAGPSVSLKCSASGNPFPAIKWFVNGQELQSESSPSTNRLWHISERYSIGSYRHFTEIVSHVNISNVQVEDGGLYECVAENLLGSASHSARLNIYGPLYVKPIGSLTLVADESGTIPCYYSGFPVDKISWSKQGNGGSGEEELSLSEPNRFSTLNNGSLKIEKASSDLDRGTYICTISNRKGESASGTVDVNIMHPPLISAFNFDENLMEGQRTSASCNVISGDLPINIQWFKDYQLIPTFLNITEMRVKFLSYLIFEKLDRAHSGTYTCSASNEASTSNHSALLSVKVPPYWSQEPHDFQVILRGSLVLPCGADGEPKPTIKWFRETGLGKLPIPMNTNDRKFNLLDDGSLKLGQIEPMDGGNYTCDVGNGLGSGLSKTVYVKVNVPTKVSVPMSTIIISEGVTAFLKCQASGDLPIHIDWKKKKSGTLVLEPPKYKLESIFSNNNNNQLNSTTSYNQNQLTTILSQLTIEKVERADSGTYVCLGSNQYGRDEERINLEVKARPPTPKSFTVDEIGSRFIRLKWSYTPSISNGAENRDPITHFTLQFKLSSNPSWTQGDVFNVTVQAPSSHTVLESGILPVTNYDIRIYSCNEIGYSLPTEQLAVLTLPEAPSGPPLNLSALPVSPKSIIAKWESPLSSLQHGRILGYQVLVNRIGNNNTQILDQKWGFETEIDGLKPNSQYRISVRAYNSAGMGPESPFVYVHTPEGVPDAPPQNIHCKGDSVRSLHVQWEPPPYHLTNGQIQGYKVIYQSVHDEKYGERAEVKKTSNRETTLHGLQSFTNYSIKTLAYTLGGEGVLSEPIYCLTEEDIPEEPSDLKVFSTSSTSALISWLTPTNPNGIITKYTIYWKADDHESSSSSTSSLSGIKERVFLPNSSPTDQQQEQQLFPEQLSTEIRRLRENGKYIFWISCNTKVGQGKSSKVQGVQLSSKVKAQIVSFPTVQNSKSNQSLLLPCKTIGVPSPKISWSHHSKPIIDTSSSAYHVLRNGSLLIHRIKESDEGLWNCKAENSFNSDEIVHKIIIHRPPPQIQLFVGYVSTGSIEIHWENPFGPGATDPPVTGYILEHKSENSSSWTTLNLHSRLTSYILKNTLCGSSYNFQISAKNIIGLGPPSKTLKVKSNGGPPSDLPNEQLAQIISGNGTTVQVDLNYWPDGGCPIHNNFQIEYKGKGGNWQRIYRRDNNSTKKFHFNTIPKQSYEVRIIIENDAGSISKVFEIISDTDFFKEYETQMKEKGRKSNIESGESLSESSQTNDSYSFFTDPHVIVPIVSALITTTAIGICLLIILKRRSLTKEAWKCSQSTSGQTWLSNSTPIPGGGPDSGKLPVHCDSNHPNDPDSMAIYATVNSAKPIPMEIRDSTVRFQTFGQRNNYDPAPDQIPTLSANYRNKKTRKKSGGSASMIQKLSPSNTATLEVPCHQNQYEIHHHPNQPPVMRPLDYRYYHPNSDDSEDETDESYPGYARPYQLTAYRRNSSHGQDYMGQSSGKGGVTGRDRDNRGNLNLVTSGSGNTLRRKHEEYISRSRANSREYIE